jgi:hypothetical protein
MLTPMRPAAPVGFSTMTERFQTRTHLVGDQSRHRVARAAGGEREDDADRPILCLRGGCRSSDRDSGDQREPKSAHVPVPVFMAIEAHLAAASSR